MELNASARSKKNNYRHISIVTIKILGSFSFSPHLQIFTCKFVDHIVRLLWKFTYRLIRPRQTYLVFILNLVKPLVTKIYWSSCEVGGGGGGGG